MMTTEEMLSLARAEWLNNSAYWQKGRASGGHFRLKNAPRRKAQWSDAVMKAYGGPDALHYAAHHTP